MRNISLYQASVALTSLDAAYVTVTNVTCLLSLCGFLLIVGFYWMYYDIRTPAGTLVLFLGGANVVQAAAGLLQAATYYRTPKFPDERSFLCETAASTYVMGQVSCALWTCAVTAYLFLCVVLRARKFANKLICFFLFFCYCMPAVLSTVAGLSDVYGYDVTTLLYYQHPAVCWISDRVGNMTEWSFLTVEGWVIATYFLSIILFVPTQCSLYCQTRKKTAGERQAQPEEEEEVVLDLPTLTAARQLQYVPLVYCFLRLWGTAHFLFTEYPVKRHPAGFDSLLIIRAFGDNSLGLANCLLFCCTTAKIRRTVSRNARNLCTCCSAWCRRHRRRLQKDNWMPQPIVRFSRGLAGASTGASGRKRTKKPLDGSDVDISNISLEFPQSSDGQEMLELKYAEDEVIFERG